MDFSLILACDKDFGIGNSSQTLKCISQSLKCIPWDIAEDRKYFRELTRSSILNAVIMGRVTADTLSKPLDGRLNIVISSKELYRHDEGFISFKDLDSALMYLKNIESDQHIQKVFVIGGSVLYAEAINHRHCREVFMNRIDHDYECNVLLSVDFIKKIEKSFNILTQTSKKCLCKTLNLEVDVNYIHLIYVNHEELKYLDMLDRILNTGTYRKTRNAKTYSVFGEKLEFDLDNGFPLLTTKKMFYRGIIEELLFFLRGETDTKILEDKKVMIWHPNTTNDFMIKNNKKLEEYDMGPMYGFQWRYFGAKYEGKNRSYKGQGFDQLKAVIDLLVTDPYSRRILMTTFNPSQAEDGVLYPCHGLTVQFYVENNRISLQMYQRSVDTVLGLPFNIASYALLLIIITKFVNSHKSRTHDKDYRPGRVIMIFGDAHIYSDTKSDHVLVAKAQILRKNSTHPFPEIKINTNLDFSDLNIINEIKAENIEIVNYICEGVLKAEIYE